MRAVRKAWSLARALLSLRHGDVKLSVQRARMSVCESCPHIQRTTRGIFCAACGCPETMLSDLRTKTRMRFAACPLDKW